MHYFEFVCEVSKRLGERAICVVVLLGMSVLVCATPRWVRHLPKAENETYRYVVESATAASEDAARNKAMGMVLQHSTRLNSSHAT